MDVKPQKTPVLPDRRCGRSACFRTSNSYGSHTAGVAGGGNAGLDPSASGSLATMSDGGGASLSSATRGARTKTRSSLFRSFSFSEGSLPSERVFSSVKKLETNSSISSVSFCALESGRAIVFSRGIVKLWKAEPTLTEISFPRNACRFRILQSGLFR